MIAPLQLVAWETTRRCPLACRHCRGAARDAAYDNELTTEEGLCLIDGIAEFAKPILILTGGEPLFRPDIFELALHASGKGMRVVMSPCGQFIDAEGVRQIKESGIVRLSISLDGATARSHDAFRGVSGAFDKTLAALSRLKEAGIEFQINTTVSKLNHQELPAILALAKTTGAVAFNPFFLVPTGRGAAIADLILSPEEHEAALTWVAEKAFGDSLDVHPTCAPHFNRILRQGALHKENTPKRKRLLASRGCLGGNGFIFISHQGILQPCGFLDISCGNVRDAGFNVKKLYEESELFNQRRNRKDYRGKCGVCEFLDACGGCRARALKQAGDVLGEEPYCLYQPKKNMNEIIELDEIDRELLTRLQHDFPVSSRPFEAVAQECGLTEEVVLSRMKRLSENGLLRRIGVSLHSAKIGSISTLVAAKVQKERVEGVAAFVNHYTEVTHNYEREDGFNLWFTIVAPDKKRLNKILTEVREQPGVETVLDLPATHLFKIDVNFSLK